MCKKNDADAMKQALADFVETIEATGGVRKTREGHFVPVGDEDWIDLGEAYAKACSALGRKLKAKRRR